MSRKRSALGEIDALLERLVRNKAITTKQRDEIRPPNGSPGIRVNLSDRALALLRPFRSEATAAIGSDASVTEILAYLHRRIGVECARPLEAGALSNRPREAAKHRQILDPEDLATVRSYAGEASTAFARHATTSEAVECMVEILLKKRRGA
jgi:hypothetical protein